MQKPKISGRLQVLFHAILVISSGLFFLFSFSGHAEINKSFVESIWSLVGKCFAYLKKPKKIAYLQP